jgi:hypothetical protein
LFPMRPECRHNQLLVFWFFLASAALVLSGCSPAPVETMTLGNWVMLIQEQARLPESSTDLPYFMNVGADQPCFEAVQSAVEWGVLQPTGGFMPDEPLTREWAASTLMHLKEEKLPEASEEGIRDIAQSSFRKEVSAAVSSGLMPVDGRGRFYPKREMEAEDARRLLAQVISWMDQRSFEEETEISIDGQTPVEIKEEQIEKGKFILFKPEQGIVKGSIVHPQDSEAYYRIEDGPTPGKGRLSLLKKEEVAENLDFTYSGELDLSQAEVIDGVEGTSVTESAFTAPQSGRVLARTHTIQDWQLSYSISASGIRAELSKKLESGAKAYGMVRIYDLKPTIRWRCRDGETESSYFRMDFATTESLGVSAGTNVKRYGDFSKLSAADPLGSLKNLLSSKSSPAEITVPIATLKIPLPEMPLVKVIVSLEVSLGADGRVELALSQDHSIGCEIRGGGMRAIDDHDAKVEGLLRSNAWITGGVRTALAAGRKKLTDVSLHTGAKARCHATLHLYDNQQNHTTLGADRSLDELEAGIGSSENILLCADVDAHLISRLSFNSSTTLAGKLGLKKTIDLLDADNGPRISGLGGHMENGHIVPRCTRTDRRKDSRTFSAADSRAILLERYVLLLKPGETASIPVASVPEGYTNNDLFYTSSSRAVSVSADGIVRGEQEGCSIVTIATSDGLYKVRCSVTVRATS